MRELLLGFFLFYAIPIYTQGISSFDSVQNLIQNYNYQPALESINRQLTKTGPESDLFYMKGMALKGLVKYTDAIVAFSNLLKINPHHVTGLIEIGNCYKMLGDLKHAYLFLEIADSLSPNAYVKTELANILFSTDQFDKSEEIYKSLLFSDTLNVFLLRSIGRCFDNMSMYDSAAIYYERTLKLNPNDFNSAYRLCNIYLRLKLYQKGIAITEKYSKYDSSDIRMNRMNAYLYLLKKDYRISLGRFRHCLENKDSSVFVNKYLGVSYLKLTIYDSAKIFLERAYFKDSMDAQTCNFLGISCAQSYWKKLGIEYLKKAITLINPDPVYLAGVYTNLAEACNGYSKYDDALSAYLKAREINPGDTLLPYRIGMQYDRWLKNKELAVKYYREFLKTKPDQNANTRRESEGLVAGSYYTAAEARIEQLTSEIEK